MGALSAPKHVMRSRGHGRRKVEQRAPIVSRVPWMERDSKDTKAPGWVYAALRGSR